MKHEATSLNTKKMFAESLKGLMEKKPLSKITISEIVADCGVNRKTFYYHFSDIYSLLKWMLDRESIDVVKQFDYLVDYRQATYFVINYCRSNKHLLCCAYDSMGRDEMKRFLYSDFIGVITDMIDCNEENLGITIEPGFKKFLSNIYTESVAGILLDEIQSKNEQSPSKTVEYLALIFENSLPGILKNAPRKSV